MSATRKAARRILDRVGLDIGRVPEWNLHKQRARLLENLNVSLVIDVGANVGQYGYRLREWSGYRGRIASFEPIPSAYRELAANSGPDWQTFNYGLSDRDGDATLHIPAGHSDLSSLSPLTGAGLQLAEHAEVTTETIRLRRLDDVIDEVARVDDRLLVKVDVQGHEREVFTGAAETLKRTLVVECELPMVAMYTRETGFYGLVEVLRDAGFSPVALTSNYVDSKTGYAMDADGLFVRSDLLGQAAQ